MTTKKECKSRLYEALNKVLEGEDMGVRCAIEEATNKHLDNQEKQERALETMIKFLDDYLVALTDDIHMIKSMAKDFNGYDFSDELQEILEEIIR